MYIARFVRPSVIAHQALTQHSLKLCTGEHGGRLRRGRAARSSNNNARVDPLIHVIAARTVVEVLHGAALTVAFTPVAHLERGAGA